MIIESIKLKSNKNTNIFEVKIDDDIYILHSDIIVKYGLSTGGEIDKRILDEAVADSEYIICLNKANEYMSTRLKTSKQLRDYLWTKQYKPQTINRVIDKLTEYGVINDEAYAKLFIESNEKKLSKRNLENKMLSRGIKKDCFEENLKEVDDSELCVEVAKKFMKNKIYSQENINKLLRHLQYKGFNYDAISKTLRILKCEDENY